MSESTAQLKVGAALDGSFEQTTNTVKRKIGELGTAATDTSKSLAGMGNGTAQSAQKIESATKSMIQSIQRTTAATEAGDKSSRAYQESLARIRGVDVAALKPYLDQLDAVKAKQLTAASAAKSYENSFAGIKTAAVAAGAALAGFGLAVGKLVSVQREFDVLNSSLITVTGSSAAAAREMQWIKDFAKETPFGLAQATQGFVKMKALGLDPTRASLTSFGNTASAMGKDLNQMIEAVADASTGEFERLKEFGIKAKKEGDNVSLTFQGLTTTIGNSASEITKYLENLGNVEFAGAMAERAKTLDGAISELGDTWDELFRTINTNNTGSLIYDSITLATAAIGDATTIINAMTGAASDNAKETGAMAAIQSGIATVFETVAVVGANLKFVLVGIGNEIGGLAAQVGQAAQFNFGGVRAIREQMVADSKSARAEIDATTARILGARDAAKELASYNTRNAGAQADPRRLDTATAAEAATKAVKATTAAIKENTDARRIQDERIRLSRSLAIADGKAVEDANDAYIKMMDDLAKANDKYIESLNKSADAVAENVLKLNDEETALRISTEQNISLAQAIEGITIKRLEEKRVMELIGNNDAAAQAIAREIEQRKLLANAIDSKDAREAVVKSAADAAAEWKKTSDQINSTLTDALMRGFESGKGFARNLRDTVVNIFKTMVLRPIISAVMSPISGAITGAMGLSGAAQAGQAGGGVMDAVNSAGSFYNMLNGGVTNAIKSGFGKLASSSVGQSLGLSNSAAIAGNNPSAYIPAGGELTSFGATASSWASAIGGTMAGIAMGSMAKKMISGGYSTGKGMETFQNIGIAVGSAIGGPVLGAIIGAGAGVFNRAFGRKLKDTGIEGSFGGQEGFSGNNYEFMKGGWLRSDKTNRSAIDPEIQKGLADQFKGLQVSSALMAQTLGLSAESVAGFTANIKLSFKDLTEAQINEKLALEFGKVSDSLAQGIIGSYKETVATVIDEIISGGGGEGGDITYSQVSRQVKTSTYTPSEFARDGETASQTLQRLATSITLVNGTSDMLGNKLTEVGLKGAATASLLIDAFGGAERYAAQMGAYYQNFYTQEEQRAKLIENTSEAFTALGKTMPVLDGGARAAYRSMVELAAGQDMSVEANRTAYASLLALQGPMNELAPAFDAVAESSKAAAEALAKTNQGWQDQLDVLTGAQTDRSIALRDAADESTRAIMRQVYAQQDLNTAATEAAKVAEENSRALADAARSMRESISSLLSSMVSRLASDVASAEQMINTSRAGIKTAYDAESAALKATQQRFASIGKTFADFASSLASSLDTPAQSFERLSAEYARLNDMARLGDTDAAAKAVSVGGQLKESIIARSGTREQAEREIAKLANSATDTSAIATTQASLAELSLQQLDTQVSGFIDLNASVLSVKDAIEKFQADQAALDIVRNAHLKAVDLALASQSIFATGGTSAAAQSYTLKEVSAALIDYFAKGGDAASLATSAQNNYGISADTLAGAATTIAGTTPVGSANTAANTAANAATTSAARAQAIRDYITMAQATMSGATLAQAIYGKAMQVGTTQAEIAAAIGWSTDAVSEFFLGAGIPKFAQGTNYTQEGLAYLHEGEAVIPRAYNPAANGGASNSDTAAALRLLADRLDRIEANTRATAGHTAGTDRKLARVIPGNALITEAA